MPRTSGHLSELRPGVYRIRVSAGRHPTTGRRRQPSQVIHGTREQAETALQDLLSAVQATPGAPRTFDELWDEWNGTTVAQRRRKATTAYTDRGLYERHIRPALGARHPAVLRPADLNALYDDLSTVLSPDSVRKIHRQIGAVLHYGCRREYLDRNVGRLAEPPRAPRHHPEAPSHSDLEQVLNHMADHDPNLWLVFRLDATVGVRRNELPALRYGDINFDTARIRIHQSVDAVVGFGWVEGEGGFPECDVGSAGAEPDEGSEFLDGFVSFWPPVAVVASRAAGGGEEALKDFDVVGVAVGGGDGWQVRGSDGGRQGGGCRRCCRGAGCGRGGACGGW